MNLIIYICYYGRVYSYRNKEEKTKYTGNKRNERSDVTDPENNDTTYS